MSFPMDSPGPHKFNQRPVNSKPYKSTPSWIVVLNAMIVTTALVVLPLLAIGAWGAVGWALVIPVWIFIALPWFLYWATHE